MFACLEFRNQNNKIIFKLFLLALFIKAMLIFVALLIVNVDNGANYFNISIFSKMKFDDIFKIFFNLDSGWYQNIALYGYKDIPEQLQTEWPMRNQHYAFFPLLPYCIMFIMKITGFTFNLSAFIFNTVALFLLVKYFYLFLESLSIKINSFRIIVLFILFPFSLHIYFIYTESIFLALLFACFYYLQTNKNFKFIIVAILLTLTRPNGLFMVLPFYLFILEKSGPLSLANIKNSFTKANFYCLFFMPLTFFIWMYCQYLFCNDWMAFSTAQKGWGKQFGFPLSALFKEGYWQYKFMSIYALIFIIIGLFNLKKWSNSFNVLVWVNILLPLCAGSAISIARYISVLFPFYFTLSKPINSPFTFKVLMILLSIGSLVCFYFWLKGDALMY